MYSYASISSTWHSVHLKNAIKLEVCVSSTLSLLIEETGTSSGYSDLSWAESRPLNLFYIHSVRMALKLTQCNDVFYFPLIRLTYLQ